MNASKPSSLSLADIVPPGVVTGDNLLALLEHARVNKYAIPAVNVTSASAANAAMEAGRLANSPVMIQLSYGGGEFVVGEGVSKIKGSDTTAKTKAILDGTLSLAYHVRSVADNYGVPIVLHSDHCAKKLLPWFDAMLAADEEYFALHREPLFSSHMLDLSEEPDDENIAICREYLKRMKRLNLFLEMEIGITGGIEDDVDNEDVDVEKLYTTPLQVWKVYKALSKISPMFSIAAAFGNVHGVYKPGNVVLSPERLGHHQDYARAKLKISDANNNPIFLVMHGGSGSTDEEFQTSVKNGVIKVNINTDTQWAYWDGVRKYEAKHRDCLQSQIGNFKGFDLPNKKYYDIRAWLRKAEESMCQRVIVSMGQLGSKGMYKRNLNRIPTRRAAGSRYPTALLIATGAILGCASTLLWQFMRNRRAGISESNSYGVQLRKLFSVR